MQSFDVIIVGAGLSGIGAAVHLRKHCPDKTFALIESREAVGGTWDLFRYPGIRSDSDMHTLGFSFKPWTEAKAIADGPSIRKYVNETADEYSIREHIQFGHSVKSANWSSEESAWTVICEHDGDSVEIKCKFLMMCSGYYNYDKAYDAQLPGLDNFEGQLVHPQFWPEGLQHAGKKVVVIGSGATAMTIVPNMAGSAELVTMVQRSPTYVVSRPDQDAIANALRKFLPDTWA